MQKKLKKEPTNLFYRLNKLATGLKYDDNKNIFTGQVSVDKRKIKVDIPKDLLFDNDVLKECKGGNFDQFYIEFRNALCQKALKNEENRLKTRNNDNNEDEENLGWDDDE